MEYQDQPDVRKDIVVTVESFGVEEVEIQGKKVENFFLEAVDSDGKTLTFDALSTTREGKSNKNLMKVLKSLEWNGDFNAIKVGDTSCVNLEKDFKVTTKMVELKNGGEIEKIKFFSTKRERKTTTSSKVSGAFAQFQKEEGKVNLGSSDEIPF